MMQLNTYTEPRAIAHDVQLLWEYDQSLPRTEQASQPMRLLRSGLLAVGWNRTQGSGFLRFVIEPDAVVCELCTPGGLSQMLDVEHELRIPIDSTIIELYKACGAACFFEALYYKEQE